jgi:tetratricopeptide (TPR) repeat protein
MIARVDEEAERLRGDDRGLEALSLMEKGLVLRHSLYGKDGAELWDACKPMAELCNMLAMRILNGGDYSLSLELLKKAELLCERDRGAQASTFNNFAVFYRKIGKLHAALTYLHKCLSIEEELEAVGVADTHLNLCAVQSQLGQHEKALEHAQEALILLQEELYVNTPGDADEAGSSDRFSVLAIAFYNIGVEQEHMYQYEQSFRSYSKGAQVAAKHLGADSGITKTLLQSKEQVNQMLGRGGGGSGSSSVKLPPVRGR